MSEREAIGLAGCGSGDTIASPVGPDIMATLRGPGTVALKRRPGTTGAAIDEALTAIDKGFVRHGARCTARLASSCEGGGYVWDYKPGSLGLDAVAAGHGGTGPSGPTASARPSIANTGARHRILASASGPELRMARCMCSDKMKYMAVVYIYEMWLPLAIKITALHPTPLDPWPSRLDRRSCSAPAPAASTYKLLAAYACCLAVAACWRFLAP